MSGPMCRGVSPTTLRTAVRGRGQTMGEGLLKDSTGFGHCKAKAVGREMPEPGLMSSDGVEGSTVGVLGFLSGRRSAVAAFQHFTGGCGEAAPGEMLFIHRNGRSRLAQLVDEGVVAAPRDDGDLVVEGSDRS